MKAEIVKVADASTSDSDIAAIVEKHSDKEAHDAGIENLDKINHLFAPEGTIHDLIARLNEDSSDFSNSVKKTLEKMSPLALAVVHEQIKRGQSLTLAQAFTMEYGLSQAFMAHTEFFEGVRALLVEKDRNPQWKYKAVSEVPREEVEWFFNFENPELPRIDLSLK